MAANFRNKPVDKRRLSLQDRGTYRSGPRAQAVARAKQYRGQLAVRNNNPQFRTEQRPGTGGFTGGLGIQQQRLREIGNENFRSQQLRGEL